MLTFNHRTALVTGAGRGIGKAIAETLARHGVTVICVSKSADSCGAVAASIVASGGKAKALAVDVADGSAVAAASEALLKEYPNIDILVNNAGILRDKTLLKMDDAMFDLVIKVHLRGTYLCTQVAARHMAERGKGGRIINTSSVSGMMGNFGQANYSSAKAGIYGLTRTASMELAKFSITVNALAPVALTRLTEDLMMFKALPNATELLAPEHVAPAALFLASELGAGITGTVLAVEGPRVYLYKMTQTEGVMPRDGQAWSAQEIKDRWSEIAGAAR